MIRSCHRIRGREPAGCRMPLLCHLCPPLLAGLADLSAVGLPEWPRVVGVGAAALCVGALWAWRGQSRRVRELGARLAQQEERLRIARELHDGMGSDFGRLLMTVQRAGGRTDGVERERLLAEASATAHELAAHSRDFVWAVSPEFDQLENLLDRLAETVQSAAVARGVRCRLDLPAELPEQAVCAATRHRVLRTLRTASELALREPGAGGLRLRVGCTEAELEVELIALGVSAAGRPIRWPGLAEQATADFECAALHDGLCLRHRFPLTPRCR